jgi:hypothetical protein
MPAYTYVSNVSPRDRFDQLVLQMDNGSSASINKGGSYNLSATELERASRFVVMQPAGATDSTPTVIVRLPVVGTPNDGDVPVWSSQLGAFVMSSSAGIRELTWDEGLDDYVPAELRNDVSRPRIFIGPTDPSTLSSIAGPAVDDLWID